MSVRRVPPAVAAALLRAVLPVARTWRFRHPDEPARPCRPVLEHAIHVCWHEHLLPLACLLARQDAATLASRDHDGEVVSRILARLGYAVARGSSTRGGPAGFRQLLRFFAGGRAAILTGDGPRGPRRQLKAGAARLAERSGGPVTVVGLACTAGWRLGSWDRFLIPAPGATVFVALSPAAPAGRPPATGNIEALLGRAVARCEQAAQEARWGRPPAVSRSDRPASSPVRHHGGLPRSAPRQSRGAARRGRGVSRQGRGASHQGRGAPRQGRGVSRRGRSGRVRIAVEGRLRAQWRAPRASFGLRLAGRGFGILHDARHRCFDLGLLTAHAAPIPVLSIGGVTAGGSGKTPLAAWVARKLAEAGHRPALLARGYPDEVALLASEAPGASVWGHPDRLRSACRAAAEGATAAIIDDGFQHRRLHRNLDLLLLDRDALRRTNRARLPAGPFREAWESCLTRADAIIVTGREERTDRVSEFAEELLERLSRLAPGLPVAELDFGTGPPKPANRAARAWEGDPAPRLALAGIMKPSLFFEQARARCASLRTEHALPDHGLPPPSARAALSEAARPGGALTTRKDLPRLRSNLAPDLPLWVLPETLTWRTGQRMLRDLTLEAAGDPTLPAAGEPTLPADGHGWLVAADGGKAGGET